MSVLYTIGHGTRSVPELAAVLTAAAVDVVIDVRRHPGSRRGAVGATGGPGVTAIHVAPEQDLGE